MEITCKIIVLVCIEALEALLFYEETYYKLVSYCLDNCLLGISDPPSHPQTTQYFQSIIEHKKGKDLLKIRYIVISQLHCKCIIAQKLDFSCIPQI